MSSPEGAPCGLSEAAYNGWGTQRGTLNAERLTLNAEGLGGPLRPDL